MNQFLTFKLENSVYAVEVHKVQEVLEYTHITKVPCVADCIEGLIDSRGQGISVVNLRKKFSMETLPPDKNTRIIVLEVAMNGETVIFGTIADSVQEVIDLNDSDIEPPPRFGTELSSQFIRGIGKSDRGFIIILSIDKIFSTDELINLKSTMQSAEGAVSADK